MKVTQGDQVKSFGEQQATSKARCLVRLVQGTSALEGQGLEKKTLDDMVVKTAKELLQTQRKLWEEDERLGHPDGRNTN